MSEFLDISQSPYNDNTKEEIEKNYYKLLFNGSRALQARELTQIQTLLQSNISRGLGTIYKEGTIITGGGITIKEITVVNEDGDSVQQKIAIARNCRMYYDGNMYDVPEQTCEITGIGDEYVGYEIIEKIITYTQDNSLTEPINDGNYGEPGADRLKRTFILSSDQEKISIKSYFLKDGKLYDTSIRPELSDFNKILAKRTYDESGNYLVDGMNLYVGESPENKKIRAFVDAGTSYVKGYSVDFIAVQHIDLDYETSYVEVFNEPFVFGATTNKYKLHNRYVKEINKVVAPVFVNNEYLIKGTNNSSDNFLNSSVYEIHSVMFGGNTYVNGQDYIVTTNGISWSPSGNEPPTGNTYQVSYSYFKNMSENVDYIIETDDDFYSFINFNGSVKPIVSKQVIIDYTFYNSRIDVISINSFGEIVVTKGNPTSWEKNVIPSVSDDILNIGYVKIAPNLGFEKCMVTNFGFKRLTMRDLFYLYKRVVKLEENQAELALEQDVKNSELATSLKGLLVDNFSSFKKTDYTHPDNYNSINIGDKQLSMRMLHSPFTFNPLNNIVNKISKGSTGLVSYYYLDLLNETVVLENLSMTDVININPYTNILGRGSISIAPTGDFWSSDRMIERTVINNVSQGTNVGGGSVVRTNTTNTSTKIGEELEIFIRPLTVLISGTGWKPLVDIEVSFGGQKVNATPVQGTGQGIDSWHIRTKADGTFQATIICPSNMRIGEHEIECKDVSTTDYVLEDKALFTSNGIINIVENLTTVTNTTTFLPRPQVDPVAQSFFFENDTTITSIDLFFATKSQTENAFLKIGLMKNGFPSFSDILLSQDITPSEVTASTNGTVASNIKFVWPINIPSKTDFYIMIGSDSTDYSIFYSKLGREDIQTETMVTKNNYIDGMMFASSNQKTWTEFQTSDLSFRLYGGEFETEGQIITENKTGLDFIHYITKHNMNIPENTNLKFFYSIDGGNRYTPFSDGNMVQMLGIESQLKFKIEFYGDGKQTPILEVNSTVIPQNYDIINDNAYLSRTAFEVPEYNVVKVIADVFTPTGTNYSFHFDGGNGFHSFDMSAPVESRSSIYPGFLRYVYQFNLPVNVSYTEFKGKIIMDSVSTGRSTLIKDLKWIMNYV